MQDKNTEKNMACEVLWDSPDSFNDGDKKVLSQYITKAVEEPPGWWKELTPFVNQKKSVSEVINTINDAEFERLSNGESPATSKKCPGIIHHLTHSLLIKSPCDVLIDVTNDSISWVASSKYMSVSLHHPAQVGKFGKDYFIVKFCIPIHLTTDLPCQAVYIDPVFYNDNGYRISPGLFPDTFDGTVDINIITIFPKGAKKYYIKNGSVLALLQFDRKIKNVRNVDLSEKYALSKHNIDKNLFTSNSN